MGDFMPMTNKEWVDIKLEEVRKSRDNVREDYVEALTRLAEEIHEKDKLEKYLKELANKEFAAPKWSRIVNEATSKCVREVTSNILKNRNAT